MDRQMELAHLELADRQIGEGKLRIASQAALVEEMRALHQDCGPAEHLLQLMRESLVEWDRHRSMIIAALNEA